MVEVDEADNRRHARERQIVEDKRRAVQDKKNQEVNKEMELMRVRKEAYEERVALKAKVEARKKAEERERE